MLVANPRKCFSARDLSAESMSALKPKYHHAEIAFGGGPSETIIDASAFSTISDRATRIREALGRSDVAALHDLNLTSIVKAMEELEQLDTYLRESLGRSGRLRRWNTDDERARTNVAKRIALAITKIAELNRKIADHLRRYVSTGHLCMYNPPL